MRVWAIVSENERMIWNGRKWELKAESNAGVFFTVKRANDELARLQEEDWRKFETAKVKEL